MYEEHVDKGYDKFDVTYQSQTAGTDIIILGILHSLSLSCESYDRY